MNWRESLDGFQLDDEAIGDDEIDLMSSDDLFFVYKSDRDLSFEADPSTF